MKKLLLYAVILLVSFVLAKKLVFYFTKKNLNNTTKLESYSQITNKSKVFTGDSHVAYFPVTEWFEGQDVLNNGIRGDRTKDVLRRIDSIAVKQPQSIFIQVGINDILGASTAGTLLTNYEKIVNIIQATSPKTRIFIQGLLPVNEFYTGKKQDSITRTIIDVNTQLKKLAEAQHCSYTDLFSALTKDNSLPMNYSVDGLHLNEDGYKVWYEHIKDDVAN